MHRTADNILRENLNQDTGGARGVAALVSGPPTQNNISAAIPSTGSILTSPNSPTHDQYGISFAEHDKYSGTIARDPANLPQDFEQQQLDFFDRLIKAREAAKPSLQERMFGEDWNSLSDYDQYTIAKEYPGQTPARRNPDFVPNMNQGGRVGLRHGTPEMGIKSLEAGAPDITYEGNMRMAQAIDLSQLSFELFGKDYDELNREEFEKFKIELELRKMKNVTPTSRGPVLPEDPTKPINPFAPKPTGPVLPDKMMAAKGGRIGYDSGGFTIDDALAEEDRKVKESLKAYERYKASGGTKSYSEFIKMTGTGGFAQGGRIGQLYGTGPAGLPGIPRMAPDGMEFDMRQNGGFQGLGAKEGKDDVPAMLAKNEFVFTADAVRGAGNGDVELGAQRMYDTMQKLERRMA